MRIVVVVVLVVLAGGCAPPGTAPQPAAVTPGRDPGRCG